MDRLRRLAASGFRKLRHRLRPSRRSLYPDLPMVHARWHSRPRSYDALPVLPAALRAGALVTVRPSSWVEDILQAITQKNQTQDHYQQSKTREETNPPLARQHVFAALADHQTPFRRRRLNPDSQKRQRTDVYDQLKERLFTGVLRAGQFVSQRELASLLGATLNPVREAIRKLEAEGLINVDAQRGI
jgi:Bacterial regulatory proteins, gntR family